MYEASGFEKIGVVHLSSRFMELVKSQSEFFTNEFKTMLERMSDVYEQTTTLKNRINVCSIHATQGILAEPHQNVKVYYLGSASPRLPPPHKY